MQDTANFQRIVEAQAYFGEEVNAYIDGVEVPEDVQASRVMEVFEDGSVKIVRP